MIAKTNNILQIAKNITLVIVCILLSLVGLVFFMISIIAIWKYNIGVDFLSIIISNEDIINKTLTMQTISSLINTFLVFVIFFVLTIPLQVYKTEI